MNQEMIFTEVGESKGADFSECGKYRFSLWRIWDIEKPIVMFIGLNPSTANQDTDDPTIRRVRAIARNLRYGGVYMMNCFPLVSTNPDSLKSYDKSIYDQQQWIFNNRKLEQIGNLCKDVIFAWGNFEIVRNEKRDIELSVMFPNAKALHINKNGSPKHPLYCRADIIPVPFTSPTH